MIRLPMMMIPMIILMYFYPVSYLGVFCSLCTDGSPDLKTIVKS